MSRVAVVGRRGVGFRGRRWVLLGFGLACLLVLSSSCLNLRYTRFIHLRQPADGHFESLLVGESELQDCLELLGAPLIVQEYGTGGALAWGWFESSDWTFSVQAPIGDESASVSFQSVDERMRGLLLLFDSNWKLSSRRVGYLRELGQELERRRPQLLEED